MALSDPHVEQRHVLGCAPDDALPLCRTNRDMAAKYNIKYYYDISDRSNFRANPDYKGVCHVALAQVRWKPRNQHHRWAAAASASEAPGDCASGNEVELQHHAYVDQSRHVCMR